MTWQYYIATLSRASSVWNDACMRADWRVEQALVYHRETNDLFGQHVGEGLYTQEEQMVCCR